MTINANDLDAVPIKRPGLAGRRAWVSAIIPPPEPRPSRNKGRRDDLARPALMWWRSTLSRSGDSSSWPDLSADNDNVDPLANVGERPWAVRDLNPRPRHTAEAMIASAYRGARFSVTTTRSPTGEWGQPKRRRILVVERRDGRTARLGGLKFTTEHMRGVNVVKEGGAATVKRPHIAAGTLVSINGRQVKEEVGRSRESQSVEQIAKREASAAWFLAGLGGGVLPHHPAPHRLFMGMSVALRAANDSSVRGEVEHVDTIEGAMIAHQEMARFRAAYPLEADVLDRTMTARRFADLAANDNPATGRRLLKAAIDKLEEFLAA